MKQKTIISIDSSQAYHDTANQERYNLLQLALAESIQEN